MVLVYRYVVQYPKLLFIQITHMITKNKTKTKFILHVAVRDRRSDPIKDHVLDLEPSISLLPTMAPILDQP